MMEDLGKYDYLAYARKPTIAVWVKTDELELEFTNKYEADQYYTTKGLLAFYYSRTKHIFDLNIIKVGK